MSALMKLDVAFARGKMGLDPDFAIEFTDEYRGILLRGILPDKTEMKYNERVSIPMETPIRGFQGNASYYMLLAVNAALLGKAEVTFPSVVLPGELLTPVMHIRALGNLDLSDFRFLATIHILG